tara:strand:+ start:668 stop:790 length:123 start_codon:yes stop_codon:yes gene_type:complete
MQVTAHGATMDVVVVENVPQKHVLMSMDVVWGVVMVVSTT